MSEPGPLPKSTILSHTLVPFLRLIHVAMVIPPLSETPLSAELGTVRYDVPCCPPVKVRAHLPSISFTTGATVPQRTASLPLR